MIDGLDRPSGVDRDLSELCKQLTRCDRWSRPWSVPFPLTLQRGRVKKVLEIKISLYIYIRQNTLTVLILPDRAVHHNAIAYRIYAWQMICRIDRYRYVHTRKQITFPLTVSRGWVEKVLENNISLSASISEWWGATSLRMKNHCTCGTIHSSTYRPTNTKPEPKKERQALTFWGALRNLDEENHAQRRALHYILPLYPKI